MSVQEGLAKAMSKISDACGSLTAVFGSVVVVLVWFVSYPVWPDVDTWMLVIGTITTIVTAVMMFVIQNTQVRDSRAFHTKLDAILCATETAPDDIMGLEDGTNKQIKARQQQVRNSAPEATS